MRHLSSKNNIESLEDKCKAELSKINFDKIAQKTGFQKRRARKIKPKDLLRSFFLMALCYGSNSLESWATKLEQISPGKGSISRQAVSKKITEEYLEFLKCVLQKVIELKAALGKNMLVRDSKGKGSAAGASAGSPLNSFGNIWLQDSTSIKLKSTLSQDYPGNSNGQNKKPSAMVKVQMIYNLRTGCFHSFTVTPFRKNDVLSSADIFGIASKGDLVLRDMGYLRLKDLKRMKDESIFFISRFKPTMKIYSPENGREINLTKLLRNKAFVDISVLIDATSKFSVRLVAIRLDARTIKKRKKKASENKRYEHTEEYMKLLEYSIFLTNADVRMISFKQIAALYRLRWRVEIIFKSWKSNLKIIEVCECHNKLRAESYLYSMLIFIVLFMTNFMNYIEEFIEDISLLRLSKFIISNVEMLFFRRRKPSQTKALFQQIRRHCCYIKQNKRDSFAQQIMALS